MNPVRGSLRHPQVTVAVTLMLFSAGVSRIAPRPRREGTAKITTTLGIVAAFYPWAPPKTSRAR